MSKMDELKNKVRSTSSSSVYPELIDSSTEVQTTLSLKRRSLHHRDTAWIENELKKGLDNESAANGRGEKNRIINETLRRYFSTTN